MCLFMATSASALSVSDAIIYVLETNPEIKGAEANKQAIEFELDQAQTFFAPRFSLEAFAGYSYNDGTATSDLTAADDPVDGYEFRGRVSQLISDFGGTRSEIERQAYRVDGAALRVLERAEFLTLEAVRVYEEVLRTQRQVQLARTNLSYHRDVFDRIDSAFKNGVLGIADLQQAEERVLLAEDVLTQFELNAADAEVQFLDTVGVDPVDLTNVPSLATQVPEALDTALAKARDTNPTIRFLQADVGSADALSRSTNANRFPTLNLEADGGWGEDMNGFDGEVRDARIGVVLRYEFQGTQNRALRQEQIRRASESRARLLTQSRLVEREVRQSWAALDSSERRIRVLQRQAGLALELRTSYESEFEVGSRTLLDVLNTQAALFQAEVNLTNAQSLNRFLNYRLLGAMGGLLPTLGIDPPEDATAYASEFKNAPPVSDAPTEEAVDAKSFRDWRKSVEH